MDRTSENTSIACTDKKEKRRNNRKNVIEMRLYKGKITNERFMYRFIQMTRNQKRIDCVNVHEKRFSHINNSERKKQNKKKKNVERM